MLRESSDLNRAGKGALPSH